jgi:hypothetical protein
MRKLLVLFGTSAVLLAQQSLADTGSDFCADVSSMAKTTMTARQDNLPMAEVMKIARDSGSFSKILEMMTEDAYESPAYSSGPARDDEIRDFENKWYRECNKARKRR